MGYYNNIALAALFEAWLTVNLGLEIHEYLNKEIINHPINANFLNMATIALEDWLFNKMMNLETDEGREILYYYHPRVNLRQTSLEYQGSELKIKFFLSEKDGKNNAPI